MVSSIQWLRHPLVIAGLMVVAANDANSDLIQFYSYARSNHLFRWLYTYFISEIDVDPLDPDYELESIWKSSIDNFVVVGENGFLLSSEIIDDKAMIETFGSSSITM